MSGFLRSLSLIMGCTLIGGAVEALCMRTRHTVWELEVRGCAHVRAAVVRGWEGRGLPPKPGEVAPVVRDREFVVI
jgi:hypothetical protein